MNKKIGYTLAVLFVVYTLQWVVMPVSVEAGSPITVEVDGQRVSFQGQGPIMVNGRVLVPVREVFEKMGFYVYWNSSARVATLMDAERTVNIPADITFFWANGRLITTDVPQQLVNGRLMLPLRVIAEAIGASVYWDAAGRTAVIVPPPSCGYPGPCTACFLPLYGRTINSYFFFGRQVGNALFDVEFIKAQGGNLVSVVAPTYGNIVSAFSIWAELNNVHDVRLLSHSFFMTNEDRVHMSGRSLGGGGFRLIELTLSVEFLDYFEGEHGLLLAESLVVTFENMWGPGVQANLIVSGDKVHSSGNLRRSFTVF